MNAIPMQNVAAMGRHGDTMLAHINAREAKLLELFGGSGTINPKTGLLEFWDDGGNDPGGEGGEAGSGAAGGPDASGVGGDIGGYEGSVDAAASQAARDADAVNSIGGAFGYYEGLNPPDPSLSSRDTDIENIAELPHAKNNYFENLMDRISNNLSGIAYGFAKGFTGRLAGKALGAIALGIPASGLGGFVTGTLGSIGMNALAENASPPSAETVAANVSPGLEGAGIETPEGTASATSPGQETATATAIPSRRALLQNRVSYPRQRIALTGLPVR